METCLNNYYFYKSQNMEIRHFEMLDRIWKRRAPKKNDDPFNKILKMYDMGPISIKNMKWKIGKFLKPRNQKP